MSTLPGDYIVTQMTAENLTQVVELEKSCGLSVWGYDGYASEIARTDAVTLVTSKAPTQADDDKLIVGFIVARLIVDELHINNIAVHPTRRRFGIGGLLLDCALTQGKTLGATWAVLEVRESNSAANSLYNRYGFEVLGRRRKYYAAPEEDALIMGMSL
jgi:ribosomal-protein-alanine N-acetyltransferase